MLSQSADVKHADSATDHKTSWFNVGRFPFLGMSIISLVSV